MEVREVLRSVRKHWIVAVVGFALAIGLGYLTFANRATAKYTSGSTIFVTQGKYPYVLPATSDAAANADSLSNLAYLYAQIAQSDLIRNIVKAPVNTIAANVVTSGAFGTGGPLPFVVITATAQSASGAQDRARAATAALKNYVLANQRSVGTPSTDRVDLNVITAAPLGKPVAARTREVIMPGVVFLTVLLLVLGAIFLLENLSRSSDDDAEVGGSESPSSAASEWPRSAPSGGSGVAQSGSARSGLLRRS